MLKHTLIAACMALAVVLWLGRFDVHPASHGGAIVHDRWTNAVYATVHKEGELVLRELPR